MCKRQKSDEDVDAFETTANVSNGGLKIPLAEDWRQASLSWGHFDMLDDPIEYQLKGISQTQINLKKGMTFASGLRSVLRQDPDIIMVGEIRDAETEIDVENKAFHSGLSGLVPMEATIGSYNAPEFISGDIYHLSRIDGQPPLA